MSKSFQERHGGEHRTTRELGGEIQAELRQHVNDELLPYQTLERCIDLIMGVLARHEGERLATDDDLPVEPLPYTSFDE